MFSRDTEVLCSTYLAFSFWRNKLSICKLFLLLWFLIDLICSIKERDCIRVIGSHASGCQASPWCCTGQWNICFAHTLGSQERKVWLQIYIMHCSTCFIWNVIFRCTLNKTILIILNLHVLMLISVGKVKNQWLLWMLRDLHKVREQS